MRVAGAGPHASAARSRAPARIGVPDGAAAVTITESALSKATHRNAGAVPAQAAKAPISGPAIEPAESIPITMPDSRPRLSGGALWVTQAIEAVHTVPLARPCRKRAATSVSAFGAKAKTTVAIVITTPDASAMRRPPMRGTSGMQASETSGDAAG